MKGAQIDPKTDYETYQKILSRYMLFLDAVNDPKKEPVRVFDPLPQHLLDQIKMIRELSHDLQTKKDEEAAKAAQKAEEELNAAKQNKIETEITEEVIEEPTQDTTKSE